VSFGTIQVTPNGIVVTHHRPDGETKGTYAGTSIEELNDAARVLGAWMDLSYEDVAKECQRISHGDQLDAFIKEAIRDWST
jgi:hypothetical protein